MATRNKSLPGNQKNFGATPPVQLSRSTFNLSKNWKGTFDAGQLVPFYVSEGLPGDSRKVRISAIARLATPFKPIMDNLYIDFHFWWVPNRQLWGNFTKMMGEQENPGDTIDYLVPTIDITEAALDPFNRLADWMGLPIPNLSAGGTFTVSALPFRAYNRIYNFHYRDQNLIDSIEQPTGDGPDTTSQYAIQKRGKRHDYFTASLPFQQKGDPVGVSLGGLAPLYTDAADGISFTILNESTSGTGYMARNVTTDLIVHDEFNSTSPDNVNLFADLSVATGITITDLRQSIAIQHVLERDARSGSRYPEILLSRFRVMDPQMLVLQRPEFLGGGTKGVTISPVPQTSGTATDPATGYTAQPQGNLAAVGTAMVDGIGFTRNFTEHGFILGIMSARADLTYQQGIERMWNRRARFDFFHPELAHLSEQAVAASEIYADGSVDDAGVWGYIGAYDDYRYGVSLITTDFRSNADLPLDVWHLSQYFANRPTLNQTFIEENPPVDRVIVTQDEPQFIMDMFISDTAARPLPISGIPGLSRI